MRWWNVRTYRAPDGTEIIRRWYDCLPEEVQTEVEFFLKFMEVTEDWWVTGDAEDLTRRHAGLTEIRFEVAREHVTAKGKSTVRKDRYRLVGCIAAYPHLAGTQDPGEFVLLLGCQKWTGRTAPPRAFDWALQLKADLENGKGYTHDCSI